MRLIIAVLSLLLLATPAMAAGGGYYIGPDDGVDMRLAPKNKATVSGHLDTRTEVEVLNRKRNWVKVQTLGHGGIRGWVPAGAVRKQYQPKKSKKKSSFFSSFASMFRSPEPTRKTAVLGVRGLEGGNGNATDKEAGTKAIQVVEWMDTLNVSQSEVISFIEKGNLKP